MNGYERRNNDTPFRVPEEVGREYEVEITDKSQPGDGVARVQGFVGFVRNGETAEKVGIKIVSIGMRFAMAEVVQAK